MPLGLCRCTPTHLGSCDRRSAHSVQAEAEEALQQAHAELAQLGRQAQQLAAAAVGAARAELVEHAAAASRLCTSLREAKERGMEAARRRLDSQVLRLAVLGGTDGDGAMLWRQELSKTTQELGRLHQQLDSMLQPVLRAGGMPGLLEDADWDEEDLSDSDDEPPQLAGAGGRARLGAAREARRAQRAAAGAGGARAADGIRVAGLEPLGQLLLPVGDIARFFQPGPGAAAGAARQAGAAGGGAAALAGGPLHRGARLRGDGRPPALRLLDDDDDDDDDDGPPELAEDPWVEE